MNRPALLPAGVRADLTADTGLSYMTRQRLLASMTAWANRSGPATKAPSAPHLRDIVEIEPGTERAAVAGYIDALQTALVAAQAMPPGLGADAGCARLISLLNNAIQANPWHP